MFLNGSEQSVTSLGHPPPSSQVYDSTSNESEKPSHPEPRRFDIRAFLSKLVGPPGIIICGQLILQIAAWGFFATVLLKGFIPIPSLGASPVDLLKPIAWVCTQTSTVLAGCSSYFFAWGVRQSITLRLHREGMSLAAFISSVQISSRSLIRDPKKLKWTVLSIFVFSLTAAQTAGWSNLITPQVLDFFSNVQGLELNLASPLLQPMFSRGALDYCVTATSNLAAFTVGQTESGYAAVNGDLKYPATVTLLDEAFFTSTAGVLPLTFEGFDRNVSLWLPNMTTIPGTISQSINFDPRRSSGYLMTQQGFTADVSCEFKNLTSDTTPSLVLETDTVNNATNGTQSSPTHINMSSDCVAPHGTQSNTSAYTYLQDGSGYLLMIACGDSGEGYTLILSGSGLYSFMDTMVCQVSPKITTVYVDYSYDLFNGTINTTTISGAPDVGGATGLSAITTIYNMFYFSQAPHTNIVGDQLRTLIQDMDHNTFDPADTLLVTAEYIRGVTEYSGSVFRACLSAKNNGIFPDGVPANMSIPTKGLSRVQFVGWVLSNPNTTFLFLIPGTLVAIATICLMLVTVAHHAADPKGEQFDPANTLDLLSASAAGGLSDVFSGTNADHGKEANDVNVVIGTIAGRGTALKRRNV